MPIILPIYRFNFQLSLTARNALDQLPEDFVSALLITKKCFVIAAFVHLDYLTQGKKFPRLFQLQVLVDVPAGKNVIVSEFTAYNIPSLAINQDTSTEKQLWNRTIDGEYRNLVAAPEQFFPVSGHIPRLTTLMKNPKFLGRIGFLFIDEAHFIITAGKAAQGDKDAFRPASSVGPVAGYDLLVFSQVPRILNPCEGRDIRIAKHLEELKCARKAQ
ncbi:hypothetical protein HYDPIDRAFT_167045 [Hydnomerulius pinastri MD-312]|nr:hypothetical protein HYDPIDRAFT_167045 [Hydnomerulius pinastri MD-312]